MGDMWKHEDKVYYIQGLAVLKGRVKRPAEGDDADYVLQNQKRIKVCDMHRTRQDAEKVLGADPAAKSPVADGQESETSAATGAKDPDQGQVGAAPAGSPKNQADASAAGGTESDNSNTN